VYAHLKTAKLQKRSYKSKSSRNGSLEEVVKCCTLGMWSEKVNRVKKSVLRWYWHIKRIKNDG